MKNKNQIKKISEMQFLVQDQEFTETKLFQSTDQSQKIKANTIIKWSKYFIILIATTAFLTLSCQKGSKDHLSLSKKVKVHIGTIHSAFVDEDLIKVKGAVSGKKKQVNNAVQRDTIQWDDGLMLVRELKPSTTHRTKSSTTPINASETSGLMPGIVYRVYVYNEQGSFLTYRDYVRGQENKTEPLLLDAGQTYSFIAFSRNSNNISDLVKPENMSRVEISANGDCMLFRKDMRVAENNENYLNINFKHLFAELTLTVDASATGQPLYLVGSRITGSNLSVDFNLLTGELLQYIKKVDRPLYLHKVNRSIYVGSPDTLEKKDQPLLNPIPYRLCVRPNTAISLQAKLFGVGSYRSISQIPRDRYLFQNLIVNPGVRYDYKVSIVPRT